MKRTLLTVLIAFLSGTAAIAHSLLETTLPAHEAALTDAPTEIVMNFTSGIRLTRVSMTHGDETRVDLNLSEFRDFISDYVISLEPMGIGAYLVEWRGLGDDGHALNGSFAFTVE